MEIRSFNINRSKEGMKKALCDLRYILLKSLELAGKNNEEPFYAVVATQLRILFCDKKPLIDQFGISLKYRQVNDLEKHRDTLLAPIPSLFDDQQEEIRLEEWLDQEILIIRKKMLHPKYVACKLCRENNDTLKNGTMSLQINSKQSLQFFKCSYCREENRDINITNLIDDAVNNRIKTNMIEVTSLLTISSLIRYYANKQGGAHLEQKLNIDAFLSKSLTQEHLFAIGLYATEKINEVFDRI